MSYSVLILTKDEEINLQDCISSVNGSDDIHLLDSYSSDNTIKIAEQLGLVVHQRIFDNYAAQRNYGLNLKFKNDWILMIDADERLSEDLSKEIETVVKIKNNPTTLYRFRRKDFFMGKWIKHSSGYPTWFGRLFRKGTVQVKREINEEYYTEGEVGVLAEHMVHYPFNKGLDYWFERHNRYSQMEAQKLMEEKKESLNIRNFFHKDPMLRRKAFKAFAYKIPFRPLLTFIFLYVFKLGMLDGRPGFHFSLMRSFYEYQIDLKMNELNQAK